MGVRRALALCPRAIVVRPRMSAYSEASKAVYRVFDDTTPLVEGLSIDEAFLDVRGMRRLAGTPRDIAERLRRDVRERVGLPITVGIARTKFLAKVASAVAKPDGLLAVPPDGELEFLHPLPVERLWGVGQVTARRLHDAGITTVRQVAELSEAALVMLLGRAVGTASARARAQQRSPPGAGTPAPSIDGRAAGSRLVGRRHLRRSTSRSWRSSSASPAGCEPPTGSGGRSCCGCASTTPHGPRDRTRCPTRRRTHRRFWRRRDSCSRSQCR